LFDQHLADSDLRGLTEDLKISSYSSAFEIKFDSGKLHDVRDIGFIERNTAHAKYPDLTFLKVLFGQQFF